MIAITCDFDARPNGICAQTFQNSAIQEYLQSAPVYGILRPLVPGVKSPEFGIDFIAVQTNESPFSGLQSDRIERFGAETQFIEFADGVGLNVDTQAKRLDVGDRFKDDARYTDLMQSQCDAQAADARPGNQYRRCVHLA